MAIDKVLVHDDPRELDPPFEEFKAGRLWRAYKACAISVYVRDLTTDTRGPLAAWFEVETQDGSRSAFEDRPLARAVAKGLGQRIVFRDPVPHAGDHPIIECSQIAMDPDGTETPMWLVEYDEGGWSRIDLTPISEVFGDEDDRLRPA